MHKYLQSIIFVILRCFQHVPKFCKKYDEVGVSINSALIRYKQDVLNGTFPGEEHCPYQMTEHESIVFRQNLEKDKAARDIQSKATDAKLRHQDEYEKTNLY